MLKNLIKIKKFKTNNNYFKINIKNIIKRNIVNRKIREIENTKQIKEKLGIKIKNDQKS